MKTMQRIIIIHGWMGSPHGDWFPWLGQELKKRNDFLILAPAMPDPPHPRIRPWVRTIRETVGSPDEETYFVGHSVGAQSILRYLETIDKKIGGAVLVAPWFSLMPGALETEEDKAVAESWLTTPIDFKKVRQTTGNFTAIFSDNDPWVDLKGNSAILKEKLGAKIVVMHEQGHFSEMVGGVTELPAVLDEILKIIGRV